MNRDEFIRIANEELEGTASAGDREILRRRLAENAEARGEYEALRNVFTRLKSVELEEAPSDLKASVLRATVAQRREQASVNRSSGWLHTLGDLLRVPNLRGAMTFASGLGVGAAAILIVTSSSVGNRHDASQDLIGTMAPRPADTGALVATRTLQGTDVQVTADTRRTSDGVILRIEATGTGAKDAQITATFDRGALRPSSLRMDPPSAGEFEVTSDQIHIVFSRAGTFTLALRAESARTGPLDLELRGMGGTTRATLETNRSSTR